jgi:hypothetical protein
VAAAVVLWRKGGRARLGALIPLAGVVIVLVVLYFSLFPLPTGWELVAPVAGVTTVIVMAVVGVTVSGRAEARKAASSR